MIVIIFLLLLLLFICGNETKRLGKEGEQVVARRLRQSYIFGKSFVLENLYVPLNNGKTTEIDLILITNRGVVVIESKNYTGYIFGDENSNEWTVSYYMGKGFLNTNKVEKVKLYNPIFQNNTHIRRLRNYLGYGFNVVSAIVFSDESELKNVTIYSDNIIVCKSKYLTREIKKQLKKYPKVYTNSEMKAMYKQLLPLKNVGYKVKKNHIKSVKDMPHKSNTCPKCGGKLVLRKSNKRGTSGNQFYGCSNYPKCRYTRNI